MTTPSIPERLRRRRPGYSLEGSFYNDPDVFSCDLERVIAPSWHLVGHTSSLATAGDFFLYEISDESILVMRTSRGSVQAFYNVCRHRGSRLVIEAEGHANRLVCPYHAWTYDTEGRLVSARGFPDNVNQECYGLKPVATEVLEGLIFICLEPGGEPWSVMERYRELLAIHGLADAKIAVRRSYNTQANWKLVVENFLECYHCPPAHPEFMRVSSPALNEAYGRGHGDFSPQAVRELEAFRLRTERLGCPSGFLPHDPLNLGFGIRKPLREGWCTTSPDGNALAPLMGRFKESDGGSTVIGFNPFSYLYGVCDHVVSFRFAPRSTVQTDAEAVWFVRGDAVEGVDYSIDGLLWLWDATLRQDKMIVTNNQLGTQSRAYEPGPYTQEEVVLRTFADWYAAKIAEPEPETHARLGQNSMESSLHLPTS